MAYTYAGQYGPDAIVTISGAPQPDAEVTVYNSDGITAATLYTDRTKAHGAANPVVTDSAGNLLFYAEPGRYVLSVTVAATVKQFNVVVSPDPAELSSDLTGYVPLAGATSVDTAGKGSLLEFTEGAPGDGHLVEIRKNDTDALDYRGTGSRAVSVVQWRDPETLADGAFAPAVVFGIESTGDGHVVPASHASTSIWQGVFITTKKTGDGSLQAFTATGEMHAVGASGYNELSAYCAELTNFASTNGTISGAELLLKDSPDAGGTSFDCQMIPHIGRIAKYNAGRTRKTAAFMASSEGAQQPDSVLSINGSTAAPNGWQTGIDFSGAAFGTGRVGIFPNNTSLAWLDAAKNPQPVMGVDAANETWLRPASAAANVQVQSFAGATVLTFLNSGVVKTAAANESTGAGSAALGANSPAVTVTSPYRWLTFQTSDGSTVYIPCWK